MGPTITSSRLTAALFTAGLGLAIASCPWQASAQPADSGPSSSKEPSGSSESGSDSKTGTGRTARVRTSAQTSAANSAADTGLWRANPAATGTSGRARVARLVPSGVAGADGDSGRESAAADEADHTALTSSVASSSTAERPVSAPAPAASGAVNSAVATVPNDTVRSAAATAAALFTPRPAAASAAPAAATPGGFVTAVASWLSGGRSTFSETLDPLTSQLMLMLVAVGRDLEKTFAYQNSTAAPVQISQTLAGKVVGSVNVLNLYGNPMAYEVSDAPTQGSVVVNADGTFTYSPNSGLQSAGGVDQFVVTVRDKGFHLFGDSGTFTVPVSVAVTPAPVAIENISDAGAQALAISGDGRRVFVLNDDNTISVVDADPASLTFNRVVGTLPVTTTVIDSGTGDSVSFTPRVTGLATDSDGSTLYLTSRADYTPSGSSATPLGVHRLSVLSVSLTTDIDGVSYLSTTQTGVIDTGQAATGVAVSADGSRIYVLTEDDVTSLSSVLTLDPTLIAPDGGLGGLLETTSVGRAGSAIGVDPTGRVYVTNPFDDTVSVINPANNNIITTVAVGGRPEAIAFGPGATGNGSYAYVANFLSNSVSVIDVNPDSPAFNTVVANIIVGGQPSGITVGPDGRHVYVTQFYTSSVAVIDTATNSLTTRLATTEQGGPTAVVAATDNAHVYVTHLYNDTITKLAVTPTLIPVPDPDATPILGSTQGYKVYNLSSQPITLTGYAQAGKIQAPAPGPGTVVAPGTYLDFEVVVYAFKDNLVQPTFNVPTAPAPITVTLYNIRTIHHIARCDTGGSQCEAIPGYKVAILDPPGTVITLDATDNAQLQQISQVLNGLCTGNKEVKCNFTPTNDELTFTKFKQFGNSIANETETPVTLRTTASQTVTNSVQAGVKFSIANNENLILTKVKIQFEASFGYTWTDAKTFAQEVDLTVPPWKAYTIYTSAPIHRSYGDFTLNMGNTQWNINNVYFDHPDPNRGGTYVVKEEDVVHP